MQAERADCLILREPAWYADPGFLAFLNDPATTTWHKPGEEPGEYSDVFITYDHGDSNDRPLIPPHVWREIDEACRDHGFEYGIVWVQNV